MINIDELIKTAIKQKDQIGLSVYRAIKTKISEFKSSKNAKEYTNEVELQLLNKMRTERLDSVKQYIEGNRKDLADTELLEVDVLKAFLPDEVTSSEIEGFISMNFLNPITKKMMGEIIALTKNKYPTADGKMIAEIVKRHII